MQETHDEDMKNHDGSTAVEGGPRSLPGPVQPEAPAEAASQPEKHQAAADAALPEVQAEAAAEAAPHIEDEASLFP